MSKEFEKKKAQVKQQVFHNLLEIVELYPQYTIAQHLNGILRRKNSESEVFYHWSDEETLKRIEQYKEELENTVDEVESAFTD